MFETAELVIHSATVSGGGRHHEETFLSNHPKRGVQNTKDNQKSRCLLPCTDCWKSTEDYFIQLRCEIQGLYVSTREALEHREMSWDTHLASMQ